MGGGIHWYESPMKDRDSKTERERDSKRKRERAMSKSTKDLHPRVEWSRLRSSIAEAELTKEEADRPAAKNRFGSRVSLSDSTFHFGQDTAHYPHHFQPK